MDLKWLESIYSDGTESFVSNPTPKLGERTRILVRMYEDAPVDKVFLKTFPNGSEHVLEMEKDKAENGLQYYGVDIDINQPRVNYQFLITSGDEIYFYDQSGVRDYITDMVYDFVIIADYQQPAWVKESVFYQIFPDRFYNGNPDNDVANDEYRMDNFPTIAYGSWGEEPLTYESGHCLDFYGGDLEGITKKIPYLKRLGVTALYLNPIFTAPTMHKYDCIDYFHVDEHFGGDKALIELSEELHKNGMRLILDISINHTGKAHIWFNRDGIFYDKSQGAYNNPDSVERGYYFFKPGTDEYKGWWDLPEMPTLNYTSEALRDIIYRDEDSVLRKWLKPPFNIDGWRFDVADVFARNNEVQLAHELWPEIRKAIKEENEEAYILAEDWQDCSEYLQGDEWDSPMNYFGCSRVLRQFAGEPDLLMDRYDYLRNLRPKMTGKDAERRITQHLAKLPYVVAQCQFNLIDSHDVSRLHNNPEVNPGDYRGVVIMQFMLLGAPSIYYGDEADIGGTLGSNEGCRYPMPWGIDFEDTERFRLYSSLAHLKTGTKALAEGGMKFMAATDKVLSVARFHGGEIYLAVMSVSDEPEAVTIPIGVLGSAGPKDDSGVDCLGEKYSFKKIDGRTIEVALEPHQALLINCSN